MQVEVNLTRRRLKKQQHKNIQPEKHFFVPAVFSVATKGNSKNPCVVPVKPVIVEMAPQFVPFELQGKTSAEPMNGTKTLNNLKKSVLAEPAGLWLVHLLLFAGDAVRT